MSEFVSARASFTSAPGVFVWVVEASGVYESWVVAVCISKETAEGYMKARPKVDLYARAWPVLMALPSETSTTPPKAPADDS